MINNYKYIQKNIFISKNIFIYVFPTNNLFIGLNYIEVDISCIYQLNIEVKFIVCVNSYVWFVFN